MEENKTDTVEKTVEQPIVDEKVGKQKIKKRRKVLKQDEPVTKVDLSKKPETKEDEVKKDNPDNEGVVTELKDADRSLKNSKKKLRK